MADEISRRSFMKLAAAAGALAAVPGCQPAARKLIPYVIPDENVIPGVPAFYATRCAECAAGCGVVARVREGRAIKLEGNPLDPISGGSLCARGQAALQELYNPDRLRHPRMKSGSRGFREVEWKAAIASLIEPIRAAVQRGANRVAFIGGRGGITLDRVVDQFMRACNSGRVIRYEPLGMEAERAAAELCFGRQDLPVYRLDEAEVLLSFGADFLETWNSPVEMARQYAAFRAPRKRADGSITIGRSIYAGSRFGITAARCDQWLPVRPGTEAQLALAILRVMQDENLSTAQSGVDPDTLRHFTARYDLESVAARIGVPATMIRRLARRFGRADGAVALAGTDDPATHVACAVLNAATGNVGRTVRFLEGGEAPRLSQHEEIGAQLEAMRASGVDVAIVAGANPLFAMPPEARAADALARVGFVAWCGTVPDETAALAHLQLPIHHTLEDWSDFRPRANVVALGQPVMEPVVGSASLVDILLECTQALSSQPSASPSTSEQTLEATWRELHQSTGAAASFDEFWQHARREGGVFADERVASVRLSSEAIRVSPEAREPAGITMAAWPHIFFYDGRGADRPWLQELPEPVAQNVWDSWAEVHPNTARRLGVGGGEILELRTAAGSIEVPAHITRGVHRDVIAVPIGQGHTAYGRYASGRGANPWQILPAGKRAVAVQVRSTGKRHTLVSPLGVADMMGRPIVETISLDELSKGIAPPARESEPPKPYEAYPKQTYPGHHWGMTIDLSACTGCSACVAACYAENNIPVVERERVAQGRIMSWIRLERYYPARPDAPQLYVMPMLCQQCDHAPCEPVCPVYASYHTDEGLNGQIYNRCIGTRYCENNCPYKVRRFNFFKYEWPAPLHLQLNPDVTVRAAGVMEKCTFCIQRIRAAEMDARAAGRAVRDGEIVTACMQACPSKAITFGDVKDPNSAMMRRRADHSLRAYRALEELNTQPAIVYLRDIYRPREDL